MMSSSLRLVSASLLPDPVEEELTKDVWDVRHLPGVRYAQHRSDYLLNFTSISPVFRPVFKRYFRLLITGYAWGECTHRLRYLRLFLEFYLSLYPASSDFQSLKRIDIENYLLYLKTGTNSYGRSNSRKFIWEAVSMLRYFLEYLERTSASEVPLTPVGKLIWPDDAGKKPLANYNEDKYIPDSVLYQLEQHMHQLPAKYLPVVIILRASGWRIGDVLNLRYDTCLERTSSGWWLCGDILKTEVMNHKVPISEEIATIVAAQQECVKKNISEQENPELYLFPSSHELRKGRPLYEKPIRNALNRLAVACEIKDGEETIFPFQESCVPSHQSGRGRATRQ